MLILMCIAVSMIPISILGALAGFQSTLPYIGLILIFTLIVSVLISIFITRPIENLTKKIDNISKGKLDTKLQNSEIHEINSLIDALDRVMASLKLAIHKVGVKKGEIFEENIEQRTETILNSLNGWAWEIDSKGMINYCSKNTAEIMGSKPEELIGKNYFEMISKKDIKAVKNTFSKAAKKETPVRNLKNSINYKNKKEFFVSTNAFPYYDKNGKHIGWRGINTDINSEIIKEDIIKELKQQVNTLKKEINGLLNERDKNKKSNKKNMGELKIDKTMNELWKEHKLDSIFITDQNANVIDCNENMYKKLGYTKGEMLDLNISDFDALESKKDIKNKINCAKEKGSITFKTIHKRKDGSAILVKENMQYLKDRDAFKIIVREDYNMDNKK